MLCFVTHNTLLFGCCSHESDQTTVFNISGLKFYGNFVHSPIRQLCDINMSNLQMHKYIIYQFRLHNSFILGIDCDLFRLDPTVFSITNKFLSMFCCGRAYAIMLV